MHRHVIFQVTVSLKLHPAAFVLALVRFLPSVDAEVGFQVAFLVELLVTKATYERTFSSLTLNATYVCPQMDSQPALVGVAFAAFLENTDERLVTSVMAAVSFQIAFSWKSFVALLEVADKRFFSSVLQQMDFQVASLLEWFWASFFRTFEDSEFSYIKGWI